MRVALRMQTYDGIDGARTFLQLWSEAWNESEIDIQSIHEAGDHVLAIMYQSGRSKEGGLPVEMTFAMLWTLQDGGERGKDGDVFRSRRGDPRKRAPGPPHISIRELEGLSRAGSANGSSPTLGSLYSAAGLTTPRADEMLGTGIT